MVFDMQLVYCGVSAAVCAEGCCIRGVVSVLSLVCSCTFRHWKNPSSAANFTSTAHGHSTPPAPTSPDTP